MLIYENTLWLLVAALVLDAIVGDPDWLWRRLPHPVVWIGNAITALDNKLNRPEFSAHKRKLNGVLTLTILLLASAAIGALLQGLAGAIPHGDAFTVVVAAVFIAQNSLYRHVAAVRNALRSGGLEAGRKAVSLIVGRDPAHLDEAGVSRAAIESCAENFSDGVVAPVFWFALFGLPGLIAYKAVNTADSMIGHKNEKHADFGWASARFDDLVNLPASRLSGLLIALSAPIVGGRIKKSLSSISKDAGKHRSPNAGWPEAAMAGALGIALAGPRVYPGYRVEDAFLNENGRKTVTATDISNALKIMLSASCIQLALVLAAALL